MKRDAGARRRILAGASSGGHWIQLMRLRCLLDQFDCAFVTVGACRPDQVNSSRCHLVSDFSRFAAQRLLLSAGQMLRAVRAERPDVVITTGSAPMLFLMLFGRVFGARAIWIDSMANCERLSTSGRIARRIANVTLSQWPDVAGRERVDHWGSVL
jgi:hypothetical protein